MRIRDLRLRRNTATNAATTNPILNPGEPGFETDTYKLKVGDGVTAWSSLPEVGSNTWAIRQPNPAAGNYFYTASPAAAGTSSGLGIAVLRVAPWWVSRTVTIDRLGADVATIGDVGSKVRLGIYADNGNCQPGNLLLDAGQVAGDSATVQELTVSLTLTPGLYWVGGAVQNVTTTQPTMRTVSGWHPAVPLPISSTLPAANVSFAGYQVSGVTGTLTSTFGTPATSGNVMRLFARAA